MDRAAEFLLRSNAAASFWSARYILLFLSAYALILVFFPLHLQSVESYAYAAAIDGYYDLSTTFSVGQPGIRLPDFGRYHPNHPLSHLIGGALRDLLHISGLTTFRFLNALGAILCLFYLYRAARLLWASESVSLAIVAMLAFSHAFWSGAQSGEVHLPSVAFQSGALFYLLRYLLTAAPDRNTNLLKAAAFFSLAVAFHLYSLFAVIAVALALLTDSVSKDRWRLYLTVAMIVFLAFIGTYLVGVIIALRIDSVQQYFGTMLMYTHLTQTRYTGAEWYGMVFQTVAHALVSGANSLANGVKLVIGLVLFAGQLAVLKARLHRAVAMLLVSWPLGYFLLNVAISGRADGINGWLFSLPVWSLACGALFAVFVRRGETKIYVLLIPALMAVSNFVLSILPASRLPERDFIFAGNPAQVLAQAGYGNRVKPGQAIAYGVSDPVLTMAEVWHTGSVDGYNNLQVFFMCCGIDDTEKKLVAWLSRNAGALVISDDLGEKVGNMLAKQIPPYILAAQNNGELRPELVPSSIFFTRPAGYRIRKRISLYIPG